MNLPDFLKILRTRWRMVTAAVLAALALAFMIPTAVQSGEGAIDSYQATNVVLINGTSKDPGINNMTTMSILVQMGEIPRRVAEAIAFTGDPRVLGNKIEVKVNPNTGIMRIIATADNPADAVKIANAFATELDRWLQDRREQSTTGRAQVLQQRLDRLRSEITDLDGRISAAPRSEADLLSAERAGKVRLYGVISDSYQQLSSGIATPSGANADVIEEASARPVYASSALPLGTKPTQLAVGLLIGLAAGIGLAMFADRFDTRIRTRQEAGRHFRFPILAQIPQLPRGSKGIFQQQTVGREGKMAADAFRMLATAISRSSSSSTAEDASSNGHRSPRTILVTSAGPGDGKTTVVANLAVAFSELGKKVLIISCDFTRPRVHKLFGVENLNGLSTALMIAKAPPKGRKILDGQLRRTPFADIHVIPSGPTPSRVGELLSSAGMLELLEEAKTKADVVLLDSPPILVSDTAHLLPIVDAVLVVARSGKTTVQLAERARELFVQFEAPVIGVALTGSSSDVVLPTSYYSPRVTAVNEAPVARRESPSVAIFHQTSGGSRSVVTTQVEDGAEDFPEAVDTESSSPTIANHPAEEESNNQEDSTNEMSEEDLTEPE